MKLITVVFACNDEHGVFEGCVRKVEFENLIELSAISRDRPPRIAFVQFERLVRIVRISGRAFPVRSFRNYVGNICCAAVQMEAHVATELLNFLKDKGAFADDAGIVPVGNAWRGQERFTLAAVEASCPA